MRNPMHAASVMTFPAPQEVEYAHSSAPIEPLAVSVNAEQLSSPKAEPGIEPIMAKSAAPTKVAKRPVASKRTVAKRKKILRGSYAVIGPATRAKIVDAALQCILKHGYYGTNTLLVQKMAGVSRGSLLNQFPTKADLMTAVSAQIWKDRAIYFIEKLRGVDPYRRFELTMDIQWDLFKQPGGVARLEITVAAISDPELKKRFEPQNTAMDVELHAQTWRTGQQLGITDRVALDNLVTQSFAALRGLAIDLLFPRDGCDTEAAFKLIKQTYLDGVNRLMPARKP